MIKILVFGFGGIGSRHVQSLVNVNNIEISIVERNYENYKTNLKNLRLSKSQLFKLKYHESLKKLSLKTYDIVIHATNADVRLRTIKELISSIKFEHIIIEKICFQNEEQFSEACDLLDLKKIKSYVHLPMRYYPSTNFLLEHNFEIENIKHIVVQGANLGILCNAIHYLDYINFLGFSENLTTKTTVFETNEARLVESKRGGKFYEAVGKIRIIFNKSSIELIDIPEKTFAINISSSISISNDGIYQNKKNIYPEFRKFTSELTQIIVQDILDGKCKLPSLNQTFKNHKIIFDIYRKLKDSNSKTCMIT